jgi:hypothetical protein
MCEVYVYFASLPDGIKEVVTPCMDGYTIYISDKLTYEQRMLAYGHAVHHIENNDFDKDNVQAIEAQAHL